MNRIRKNTMGMFDCLKGAIMVIVILTHCFTDVVTQNPGFMTFEFQMMMNLGGLTMVLLFLCSGYGFKPIKNKKGLKLQFQQLIRPCFTLYALCFLVRIPWNLLWGRAPFAGMVPRVLGFALGSVWYGDFLGFTVFSIQTMWYLFALFFDWLILTAVFRLKEEKHRFACVAALSVLGLVLTRYLPKIPFCLGQTLLSVGYVYAGYILKKENLCFKKLPRLAWAGMGLVAVYCLVYGDVNIGICIMKLGLLDYVGILFAAFLCLRLYLILFDPEWKLYQPFMFFGKNSLLILLIHSFDHQTFSWRELSLLQTGNPQLFTWVFFALRFAATIAALFGVLKFKTWNTQRKLSKKGSKV